MSPDSYIYTEGLLPPYLKAQLGSWPASGNGTRAVHRHIITLANGLRHYVEYEEAVELIKASMPRRPKGREVDETVERAYEIEDIPKAKKDRPPNLAPNVAEIEQIVAERITSKSALAELEESSPAPIPASTEEAMYQLFKPDDLICHASDCRRAVTRMLRQMVFFSSTAEYVVPSPMSAPYTLDGEGKKHYRGLANTGPRKFIVCDLDIKPGNPIYADLIAKWAKCNVTVQDAQAAIIKFLAEHGPLSMVVYSGNVSLQAWFYCAGESDALNSPLRGFFESAMILGADRAGWTRCQLFRMPGALRANTGHRQTIHFFNPPRSSIKE
jgi:hypothetical protein